MTMYSKLLLLEKKYLSINAIFLLQLFRTIIFFEKTSRYSYKKKNVREESNILFLKLLKKRRAHFIVAFTSHFRVYESFCFSAPRQLILKQKNFNAFTKIKYCLESSSFIPSYVRKSNKGGFIIDVSGVSCFLPHSKNWPKSIRSYTPALKKVSALVHIFSLGLVVRKKRFFYQAILSRQKVPVLLKKCWGRICLS